jgi:hypothetical protein
MHMYAFTPFPRTLSLCLLFSLYIDSCVHAVESGTTELTNFHIYASAVVLQEFPHHFYISHYHLMMMAFWAETCLCDGNHSIFFLQ